MQPARRKRPTTIADRLVAWERLYYPILEKLASGARTLGLEPAASILVEASRAATELAKGVEPDGDD